MKHGQVDEEQDYDSKRSDDLYVSPLPAGGGNYTCRRLQHTHQHNIRRIPPWSFLSPSRLTL